MEEPGQSLPPREGDSHTDQNLMKVGSGTSLVVQWVRLHASNAGGLGSALGGELDPACRAAKRLHAATKTQRSQNKSIN